MLLSNLARDLARVARRFAKDDNGNIAVIFVVALIPLLGFVGAAIDFTRASRARSSMQAALDSAALMVSKDLASDVIKVVDIPTKAQSYFKGLYTGKDAPDITVTASYAAGADSKGSTVLLTGTGSIATQFMNVMGFKTMPIGGSSTATWGNNLLRIALVLDITGSMNSDGKIGALKTASKTLVDKLGGLAKKDGDVYMSVIPFASSVNVGTSNKDALWLRWDFWDPKRENSSSESYCSNSKNGWYDYAMCKGHGYTWSHTPNISDKSLWKGCVTDRDKENDVSSTAPSSAATNFIADQDFYCPAAPIIPLTYNWSSIKTMIDSLTPNGGTNQTIGLHWGWLSLMQQAPLNAPAETANDVYQHVIILFTDGLNTINRWDGTGSMPTSTSVDGRMQTLCSNIKAVKDPATGKSKFTIYVVQVDTGGDGVSAVLPACATSVNEHFFLLTAASQISDAFAKISTSISKLRVAS